MILKKTKRNLLIPLTAVLILTGCSKEQDSSETSVTVEHITLNAVQDMTVEYGKDTKEDAVKLLTENLKEEQDKDKTADVVMLDGKEVKITAEPETIDTTKLGSTDVTYTFTYQQNGTEQSDQKKITVTIQDTKAPAIHASHQYEIRLGQTFYPEKVIASVEDPVDGSLKLVSSEPSKKEDQGDGIVYDEGWYTVNYSVNTWRTGTYYMQIHAVDKHGLTRDDDAIAIIVNSRSWTDARYTYTPTYEPDDSDDDNDNEEPAVTTEPETPAEPTVEPEPEPTAEPSVEPEPEQPTEAPSEEGTE